MTTTREPPWARLHETARRFTLGQVRPLCARLPRARTKAIHDVTGALASFALPNGDLLWGTQGEILGNLLEQLVALPEPSGRH